MVSASTWVAVLVVTSSSVVVPWLPQGGCVWLVTHVVELPLSLRWEEEDSKNQRSADVFLYSHSLGLGGDFGCGGGKGFICPVDVQ